MMSRAPRWPEKLVNNTKISRVAKEPSCLTVSSSSGGNIASKASFNGGRSTKIFNKTLKKPNHQVSSSPSSKPALQLCSSRSFSSLHTPSLYAAPCRRSSRSLNRLDQRSTRDESDVVAADSTVKIGAFWSSAQQPIRTNKERKEKKRMSSSTETINSSCSERSTTTRLQNQHKDAVAAGIKHNVVQTVLKNVKPPILPASPQLEGNAEVSSKVEQQDSCFQENHICDGVRESHKQEEEQGELKSQQKMAADMNSSTDSSSSVSPAQQVDQECSILSPACAEVIQTNDDISDQQRICEKQTEQLVKELEETQKEVSRLQQSNTNLQQELQQQRESHSREKKDLLSNSKSPSEPTLTLQQLQKVNRDLRAELDAQKRKQEEAREAELRQRVDHLAQQAQLLVTGDATALAQAHLEQERQWFIEQRTEWERTVTSLKSQLSISEGMLKESETRATLLQEQSLSHHALQAEAEELRKALQEVTTQLRTNEETQAQKETLLQKHLMLLQASQDRERRSLSVSLARAEQHSQELQERLVTAEEQVDSLSKDQMWKRDVEEAQHKLKEELASSLAVVRRYRNEKEELEQQCHELQNMLFGAEEEARRLQSCLKKEEAHFHELNHSYLAAGEQLRGVLQKVQQKEAETQDMREGFEKLLNRKEQELSEVLLKMEVLGISLEETEAKLSEVLDNCTCATSHLENESTETGPDNEDLVHQSAGDSQSEERDKLSSSSNDHEHHYYHARVRSHSLGPSHQYIITSGDDPERFTTVIQLLETKLFVTEEKLREITHQLSEHQEEHHMTLQDPQLYSQLTQSQSSAQHLNLLLHSRAEQSQRFAKETDNLCRLLSNRLQAALRVIQSCSETLQTSTTIELNDFERKLTAVAAYLQQGREDAAKHQCACFNACKGEDDILSEALVELSDNMSSPAECLMRELVVVEKMVTALQSPDNQLESLMAGENYIGVAHRYELILAHIGTLKKTGGSSVLSVIISACTEAELIYAAFKIQQQCQEDYQEYNGKREGLAHPLELACYEEQGEKREVTPAAKMPPWLQKLITRLQKRARLLWQLRQEVPGTEGHLEIDAPVNINWMQEQAKLVYLSERLFLDLEQEQQRCVVLQDKLKALVKQQEALLMDKQKACNHT
ncbi:rootletin isoform X2 [Entelurus aequoreus]|uniref:rootletin isoform X2 n=1 Tax=Entelurus aequoreus TaxID=161455 RepID=UPI002B1CFF22|nr:rootletin isoform X2 [Entelurus aequoreus]